MNSHKTLAALLKLKKETVFPYAQLVSILIRLKHIRFIYISWSELNDDIFQCNQPGSISIQLKQRGSPFIRFNGCCMNKSYKLKSMFTHCLNVQCDLTVGLPDLITIWLHSMICHCHTNSDYCTVWQYYSQVLTPASVVKQYAKSRSHIFAIARGLVPHIFTAASTTKLS